MHTNRLQLGDANLICNIWCEYLFVSVMLFKVYKAAFYCCLQPIRCFCWVFFVVAIFILCNKCSYAWYTYTIGLLLHESFVFFFTFCLVSH